MLDATEARGWCVPRDLPYSKVRGAPALGRNCLIVFGDHANRVTVIKRYGVKAEPIFGSNLAVEAGKGRFRFDKAYPRIAGCERGESPRITMKRHPLFLPDKVPQRRYIDLRNPVARAMSHFVCSSIAVAEK
jgi:hypothetical protein